MVTFFFITIGWHLWTASDKEKHSKIHTHTHTHTKIKQFKRLKLQKNRFKNTVQRLNGMYEVCSQKFSRLR